VTTVLVADDHEVVRHGLRSLLADTDVRIVAEAKSAAEAVRLAIKHKPDVVLLDVRMDGNDGLAVIEKIRRGSRQTKVVMFSNHDNPVYIARAYEAGAVDYLLKGSTKAELLQAIDHAVNNIGPIRTGEMHGVKHAINSAAAQKHEDLPITPRELEVLKLIANGQSNKEIGRAMDISVETVKEHVQNLLGKLAVVDRTQAAVLAVRMGIV